MYQQIKRTSITNQNALVMAKDKKGFILYADLINVVSQLPDETAGKLFKIILTYVNDLDVEIDDLLLKIAFEPIKNQLKRDLKKFEDKKQQYSDAGKASAEVRRLKRLKEQEQNTTTFNDVKKDSTDSTVIVNDTVTVKVNDKVKVIKTIEERKTEFKNSLTPFLEEYDSNLLNEFYSYWTEHGPKDKKMRWEKQKSFGISRRLSTWKRNQKKFGDNSNGNLTAVEKLNKKLGING